MGGGGGGDDELTTMDVVRWIVPQARPTTVNTIVSVPLREPVYAIDTVPDAVPEEGLKAFPRLDEMLQLTAFAVVSAIVAEAFC